MAQRLPGIILAAFCPWLLAACMSSSVSAPPHRTSAPRSSAKATIAPRGDEPVVLTCGDELAPTTSAKGSPHTLGLASDGWARDPGLRLTDSSRLDSAPYSFLKTYTYITSAAAPRVSIRIIRPRTAWLFYTSGAQWAHLTGKQVLQGATKRVEVSRCQTPLTGYAGEILLKDPTCVTLRVSAHPRRSRVPHTKLRRIPLGKPC